MGIRPARCPVLHWNVQFYSSLGSVHSGVKTGYTSVQFCSFRKTHCNKTENNSLKYRKNFKRTTISLKVLKIFNNNQCHQIH